MTSKDLRSKTGSKFRPAYVASAFSLVLSGVSAVAIADAAFAAKPFQVRPKETGSATGWFAGAIAWSSSIYFHADT